MVAKFTKPVGIEQPDEADIIWNYMSFCNFKRLTECSQMYFAQMNSFSDFQEGRSTESDLSETARDLDSLSGGINEIERSKISGFMDHAFALMARTDHYVYCWSLSTRQANLMWKTYGNGCRNDERKFGFKVAIKSTVSQLKKSLTSAEHDIAIGRVRYIDVESDNSYINGDDSHESRLVFTKGLEYQDEHELRLSINSNYSFNAGRFDKPMPFGNSASIIGCSTLDQVNKDECIMVNVELTRLIDCIYIEATRDFGEMNRRKGLVKELLTKVGCSSVIIQESYVL
jgi:hypothetical protein